MELIAGSGGPKQSTKGTEILVGNILKQVFVDTGQAEPPSKLNEVENYVKVVLDRASTGYPPESSDAMSGRIGVRKVTFDMATNVGSFIVDKERLGVSSQGNFSTILANTCVYTGRWHYELLLGSKGVMQVGWTTPGGQFSQEKGVGDTSDSYAYDGNRIRKWNVATNNYGEAWLTGDVIGCTVDLERGSVGFYRNGHYLGEAFDNIRTGPGLSYFPAVSLAYTENLVANFGATPFKHPVPGFQPLQAEPRAEVIRACQCLEWMRRIVDAHPHGWFPSPEGGLSWKAALILIASHIFHHLGPLLMSPYVVEAAVIPFLMDLLPNSFTDFHCREDATTYALEVNAFLDLLWSVGEDSEIHAFLENLAVGVLTGYRFAAVEDDYGPQRHFLQFMVTVLEHQRTRHFLLQNVLFDKIKFPVFLHVKPPDDAMLRRTIPHVWWDGDEDKDGEELAWDSDEEIQLGLKSSQVKEMYFLAVANFKQKIEELEQLQLRLLLLLLREDAPNDKTPSSRAIFRIKFREFLKENMIGNRGHIPIHLCPLPVTLCFFHCLVRSLKRIWTNPAGGTSPTQNPLKKSSQAAVDEGEQLRACNRAMPCIPAKAFVDGTIDCFEHRNSESASPTNGQLEVRRLGGLASHLRKTYPSECGAAVAKESKLGKSSLSGRTVDGNGDPESLSTARFPPPEMASLSSVATPPGKPSQDYDTLVEILDGTILLYHISAHKQLSKMCALRDSMQEYVDALSFTKSKLRRCEIRPEYEVVKAALLQSGKVFVKKLREQGRHMAWVRAVVYSQDKRADVDWLLRVLIQTLNSASRQGNLFTFVPDFYVDACINSCAALGNFFTPCASPSNPQDFLQLLVEVALFLSQHFADKRIVSADVKDNLIQALASFVCKTPTLKALESISCESRMSLVRKLLQPYENRAWAQSNWILVRFWKGCGLAFRYTQPPHLAHNMGPKLHQVETPLPNQFYKPCPSLLYQGHIAEVLLTDQEGATAFLNSVLNQLNWAFSEFVGMLQEIQNLSNSVEGVFVDPRQLKICSTCFDLAVALLRVLEMVVHIAASLFTDWSRPTAEPLLARLCQLICQVLNRVTSRSGCFNLVISMEIPGLETIDHFPIVTAVIGILIHLLMEGDPKSRECATAALLTESSFQLSSLEFVLGLSLSNSSTVKPFDAAPVDVRSKSTGEPMSKVLVEHGMKRKRLFSLKNYKEVSPSEINQIEQLLQYLWAQQAKVSAEAKVAPEEDMCPICYANPNSAIFRPCGHQSCRACISHQLMNKSECFFCKSNIEMVVTMEGVVLHELRRKQTTV